jgi:drug/metabolite transporter (DMT)-like permease
MRDDVKGATAALGAAALFGAGTPLSKLLLADAGPLPLSALLYLGAGIGLAALPYALPTLRTRPTETPLRGSDVGLLVGIIVLGGILGPLLMLVGLTGASGLVGSLALNLEAPLTMLLAVLAFGEHLSRREAGAAAVIVAGVVVLSAHGGKETPEPLGVAAIAAACLCWAVDNNLTQRLSLRDPIALSRLKCLCAGTTSLLLVFVVGGRLPTVARLLPALLVGLLSYGLSLVLAVYAMRLLGAAREAALFAIAPFVGALVSVPVLGDRPGTRELVAAIILGVGVFRLVRAEHGHVHSHTEIEHEHGHTHDDHHQHEHASDDPAWEPHAHRHRHQALTHAHPHRSDVHHRHRH